MTLLEHFKKFYNVKRAITSEELEQCYRIRHRVFCRELNYFDAEDYEMEIDEYDSHSAHALLYHLPSNSPVACVRAIAVDPKQPEKPMPYELVFKEQLNRKVFDPDVFLPGQITEFSRLSVLPEFRNHRMRDANLPENIDLNHRCGAPIVPLALFAMLQSLFFDSEAEYGAAMMEPRLAGLIRRSGFRFEEIGDPVKHCGWRSPFIFDKERLWGDVKKEVSDLLREVDDRLMLDKKRLEHPGKKLRLA